MVEETDKKKLLEVVEDEETLKKLKQIWAYRQEIRLMHRRIDRMDFNTGQLQSEIQEKHKLEFPQMIILSIIADEKIAKDITPNAMKCRYCPATDEETDIYLVKRKGIVEGFCLPCYEKYLDDKREMKRRL
jgi:adenine C2-methylase RlmN of 23S rRNA A2503 and tRNA A37